MKFERKRKLYRKGAKGNKGREGRMALRWGEAKRRVSKVAERGAEGDVELLVIVSVVPLGKVSLIIRSAAGHHSHLDAATAR